MDRQGAAQYLTNTDWRKSRLGLERINELLTKLGSLHEKLRYVHVAGTNGKGSVSAMLAGILHEAGYKTGLYTSPYINRFNERIQVDGQPIGDDALAEVTGQVRQAAETMTDHPTEFELITAVGLKYFYEVNCDIVVLEVGLGGRLDATNIIPVPEAAVITSIGLDHTAELGNTLEKIAAEKAGIIKPGGDVVLYPQSLDVERVIEQTCKERGARLTKVDFESLRVREDNLGGQRFDYGGMRDLHTPLPGDYQRYNAAVALTVTETLREKGWQIGKDAVCRGLEKTKWPARFELVYLRPAFIVDGGHNPQGAVSVRRNLERYFPGRKVTFLIGVMADKDYEEMFSSIIPLAKRIITVAPNNPRALPAEKLADYFKAKGFDRVAARGSVKEGIDAALEAAEEEEVICAFGSFYMAGAVREYFNLF